jgi:16S rRNA processing protein RimM
MATEETAPVDFWERFPRVDSDEADSWVFVGRITRTVGLKGAVRVTIHSDFPERFAPGATLLVECEGHYRRVTVVSVRHQEHHALCTLELKAVDDRHQADYLRGKALFVPKSERLTPPRDCFYPDEMVGMKVLAADGTEEGSVRELVIDTPSPYLVIDSARCGQVLIPFRKEFLAVDRGRTQVRLVVPLEMHVPQ